MDFPFVGAGDASYFERAEVHVRFTRSPTSAQQKRISATTPVPLRHSITFSGPHLVAISEQGVGRLIAAAYATSPRKPARLTTTGRLKQAGSSQLARFNADIEKWLYAAHAIVPILVAFRGQDLEAGGTTLSAWHHESLARARALVRKVKTTKPERYMRDGIVLALDAATQRAPTPTARAEALFGEIINIPNQASAARRAKARLADLDTSQAWWIAADELALYIACCRDTKLLARAPARALVLDVFRRALTGKTPSEHARAFQFRTDQGLQSWRLPRILAIAAETALRHGDAKALAHFRRGLDLGSADQRSELESSATDLEAEGLADAAKRMRGLVKR